MMKNDFKALLSKNINTNYKKQHDVVEISNISQKPPKLSRNINKFVIKN